MTNIKIIEAIIYPTSVRRCGVRRACIECQESLLWPGWRPYFRSVYGWCSEGFNTVDLKEAKALLDELK